MTTTTTDTTDAKVPYRDACSALRDLAQVIVAATEVRYDPPPGMTSSKGETGSNVADVSNPVLDTVLDKRRSALSDEITDLAGFLRTTAHSLTVRRERLDRALARWEGDRV